MIVDKIAEVLEELARESESKERGKARDEIDAHAEEFIRNSYKLESERKVYLNYYKSAKLFVRNS